MAARGITAAVVLFAIQGLFAQEPPKKKDLRGLIEALQDEDANVRVEAAVAAIKIEDRNEAVRKAAREALGRIRPPGEQGIDTMPDSF